jgi:maltose/moltooligosaccharide transporter
VSVSTIISPMPTQTRTTYITLLLVGLGGLFAGVTGPLTSAFVPILVRDALGDHRAEIGAVMAIDNVLLLLLVPWAGVLSDRAIARGGTRKPLVLAGFGLAAVGMAIFPWSSLFGIWGVIAAIVILFSGVNIQRSPFQALVADLIPSRDRSLATASVTFQMCVGAIVFLMLGRILGMKPAFLIAGVTVFGIAAAFVVGVRVPTVSTNTAIEATFRSMVDATWSAVRGAVPGMRAVFIASVLLQMIFQSFTTWFALHGTERFNMRPEDVAIPFIAWAMGGVVGALPAGMIGVRIGRRKAMLVGYAVMFACFVALDRVTHVSYGIPLLALASAGWAFPQVNAYPLFIEHVPQHQRGALAALFLLSMALGGGIGDPLNGTLFDFFGSYRPLFVMMAGYTALAFGTMLFVPHGAGEADTGSEAVQSVTGMAAHAAGDPT